jgi:hypothetical protein
MPPLAQSGAWHPDIVDFPGLYDSDRPIARCCVFEQHQVNSVWSIRYVWSKYIIPMAVVLRTSMN